MSFIDRENLGGFILFETQLSRCAIVIFQFALECVDDFTIAPAIVFEH